MKIVRGEFTSDIAYLTIIDAAKLILGVKLKGSALEIMVSNKKGRAKPALNIISAEQLLRNQQKINKVVRENLPTENKDANV